MTTNDDLAAPDPGQPPRSVLDDIARLAQRIKDSKQNPLCARADEPLIRHALDRMDLTHVVNLHPSSLCPAGQMYVTPSHDDLFDALLPHAARAARGDQ